MSTKSSAMERIGRYGNTGWIALLTVSLLAFAANFGYATHLQGQENKAKALTSDLNVLSQQLAKYSKEAVEGNADSFDEFKATKARIDTITSALTKGSSAEGVPGYAGSKLEPGVSAAL